MRIGRSRFMAKRSQQTRRKRRVNWPVVMQDAWRAIDQSLSRALVGLCWSDQLLAPRAGRTVFDRHDVQPRIASGCLLEIRGLWFFLTAGHVLDEIESAPKCGRRTFRFELLDSLHLSSGPVRQPFPVDPALWLKFDMADGGWDFGLIPIPELIKANLLKVGMMAVSISAIAAPRERFHCFALSGFPRDQYKPRFVDMAGSRFAAIQVGMPLLPVEYARAPGIKINRKGRPFVGKIVSLEGEYQDGSSVVVRSIKGMSGGPIWGLKFKRDKVAAKLVAVQSRCYEPSMTIVASRVCYIVDAILRSVDQAKRSRDIVSAEDGVALQKVPARNAKRAGGTG